MNLLKRKPKQKIIKYCPRYAAGHYCHMVNGIPCWDCGRGMQLIKSPSDE